MYRPPRLYFNLFLFIYFISSFIHLFAFSPKEDFFFICYYLITILQDDDDDERRNAKSLPALHIIPPPSPSRGSSTPHTYITSNSRKAGTTTISHSNPSSSSSRVTCNAAVVVGRSSRSDAYIHTSCRPAPLGHFSSQLSRSTSRGTGRRECVFVLFYSPVFFFYLRCVQRGAQQACIDGANYI